jgi:glycosyltransferase involved in cell wall biosynthesis
VFYFVGKDTSVMAENIKAKSINISEIIITGMVSELEKTLLLKDIDVLICPSREDPMPAVVVEAMKNRKATIVSSACGIAEYIRERVNGLVFESENVDDLKNKIIWCIENNEKLDGMGNCSYEIFRDKFSMESYEEQVLKIVKGNTNV